MNDKLFRDWNGLLRLKEFKEFKYDKEYTLRQGTNIQMTYLRLGCLLGHIKYEKLKQMKILEIGPGSGILFNEFKKIDLDISGYDIANTEYSTVSYEDVMNKKWDLILGFDVLEHMQDIDNIFQVNFRYGFFSVPCFHKDIGLEEWRHYKPNEHLWYLDNFSFMNWLMKNDCCVLFYGCLEDVIRKRWAEDKMNITSAIIERSFYK